MKAQIMDGKSLADIIKEDIRRGLEEFEKHGVMPCLATLLVGDDPASKVYLRKKHQACKEVGIRSLDLNLPQETEEGRLLGLLKELNEDERIHGILVQLPLPRHLDGHKIIEAIKPEKDVDGLHPINLGRIAYRKQALFPCTPRGIVALLRHYAIPIAGRHVVILNRSPLVGRPLFLSLSNMDPLEVFPFNLDSLLLNDDATITICHSKTHQLEEFLRQADILISAVGRRPHFSIKASMVKEGAVVIDVGMSRVGGRLLGDVEFEEVAEKASFITPVPGGVGPMTVVMLLYNTLVAASLQTGIPLPKCLERWA